MLKSKAFMLFVLIVLGFSVMSNFGESKDQKLDYEEIDNITVIYE